MLEGVGDPVEPSRIVGSIGKLFKDMSSFLPAKEDFEFRSSRGTGEPECCRCRFLGSTEAALNTGRASSSLLSVSLAPRCSKPLCLFPAIGLDLLMEYRLCDCRVEVKADVLALRGDELDGLDMTSDASGRRRMVLSRVGRMRSTSIERGGSDSYTTEICGF
jgi:hypothetical protein